MARNIGHTEVTISLPIFEYGNGDVYVPTGSYDYPGENVLCLTNDKLDLLLPDKGIRSFLYIKQWKWPEHLGGAAIVMDHNKDFLWFENTPTFSESVGYWYNNNGLFLKFSSLLAVTNVTPPDVQIFRDYKKDMLLNPNYKKPE